MLVQFIYGPKANQSEHVSRTTGDALIAGGFAVECAPENTTRKFPPAQWRAVSDVQTGRVLIEHIDGRGNSELFDGPPQRRQWVFRPGESEGHYEVLPDENCPPEVITAYKEMKKTEPPNAGGPWGTLGAPGGAM